MSEKLRQLVFEANPSTTDIAAKGVFGFSGAITAAHINTWIGICAGLLTCVYMLFQIEAAWRKRKDDKKHD